MKHIKQGIITLIPSFKYEKTSAQMYVKSTKTAVDNTTAEEQYNNIHRKYALDGSTIQMFSRTGKPNKNSPQGMRLLWI